MWADATVGAAPFSQKPSTKRCTKCGIEKPRTDFYVQRRLKNGGIVCQAACKPCAKRIRAQWRAKRRGVEYKPRRGLNHTCTRCGHLVAHHTNGLCQRCSPHLSPQARDLRRWKLDGTLEWRKAL